MAWGAGSSARTSTAAHKAQRTRVLQRDGFQCQLRYRGCITHANEMDHRDNVAGGGSDVDANMQAVCTACHKVKTQREAQAALARRRSRLKLPKTPHPGLR